MVQPITTVQWLRRVLFRPIAGVLLLAWLLYGVELFQTQLRDQQARIDTIGQLMAVLVGHWGDLEPTGQHGVILRQLLQAGDVPQVHYLPLGSTGWGGLVRFRPLDGRADVGSPGALAGLNLQQKSPPEWAF